MQTQVRVRPFFFFFLQTMLLRAKVESLVQVTQPEACELLLQQHALLQKTAVTLHMLPSSLRRFARLRRNPVQRAFFSSTEPNTHGSQNRTFPVRPLHVFLGAQAPRIVCCLVSSAVGHIPQF